jgi:hypothetical protein
MGTSWQTLSQKRACGGDAREYEKTRSSKLKTNFQEMKIRKN